MNDLMNIEPGYGRLLHSAFSTRLKSDYEPGVAITEEFAAQFVEDAVDFVSRLERIIYDTNR
jgi:uncharacterized protein (UPF0332 family)